MKAAAALDVGDDFAGWHVETAGGSYVLLARSGAEGAVASWDGGETDALVLAVAHDPDGELQQLVCLAGKKLRIGGIQVTEGSFDELEIVRGVEEVAVRYEGEGALKLVMPWPVKGLNSGPEGAQATSGEQGAVLVLPGPGYYELSL